MLYFEGTNVLCDEKIPINRVLYFIPNFIRFGPNYYKHWGFRNPEEIINTPLMYKIGIIVYCHFVPNYFRFIPALIGVSVACPYNHRIQPKIEVMLFTNELVR